MVKYVVILPTGEVLGARTFDQMVEDGWFDKDGNPIYVNEDDNWECRTCEE